MTLTPEQQKTLDAQREKGRFGLEYRSIRTETGSWDHLWEDEAALDWPPHYDNRYNDEAAYWLMVGRGLGELGEKLWLISNNAHEEGWNLKVDTVTAGPMWKGGRPDILAAIIAALESDNGQRSTT